MKGGVAKMVWYMLPVGVLFFVLIIDPKYRTSLNAKPKRIKTLFVLSLATPILMMAFRGSNVGADTGMYINNFYFTEQATWKMIFLSEKDIGYYVFVKILTTLTNNPQILIITTSLFIGFCYIHFFQRNTNDWLLSSLAYLTFGLFFFNLTGIRQSIAMAISVLSIKFIQDKKLIKFILYVLFASFFHKSALFFLVAYFIGRMKVNIKNTGIFALVGIFSIVFSTQLLEFVAQSFEQYSSYGIESTQNGTIFFIIVAMVTLLSIINMKSMLEKKPSLSVLINLNYITCILWALRLISRTAERPSLYFMPATIIIFSESIFSIKDMKTKKLIYVYAAALTVMLYIYRVRGITYSFFW